MSNIQKIASILSKQFYQYKQILKPRLQLGFIWIRVQNLEKHCTLLVNFQFRIVLHNKSTSSQGVGGGENTVGTIKCDIANSFFWIWVSQINNCNAYKDNQMNILIVNGFLLNSMFINIFLKYLHTSDHMSL